MTFDEKIDTLIERVISRVSHAELYKEETTIHNMRYAAKKESGNVCNCFYEPCFSCILQGRKHSVVGSKTFNYGRGSTLAICLDMPSVYSLVDVNEDKPFVAISFTLDKDLLSKVFNQMSDDYFTKRIKSPEGQTLKSDGDDTYGMSTDLITEGMLDVLMQLTEVEAGDDEMEKRIIGSSLIEQFYFYMLQSSHGIHLYNFYHSKAPNQGIVRSIAYLREHFKENFDVDEVAKEVAYMQPSTFFKKFKESTGVSPLQYKKRLRLVEAKRLIEIEQQGVSQSAYQVGYESISQFSREFKQLFNMTPSQSSAAALNSELAV